MPVPGGGLHRLDQGCIKLSNNVFQTLFERDADDAQSGARKTQ